MLEKDTDLDGSKVVELEAEPARDVDFDADQGALLVIPTAIVGVAPATARWPSACSSSAQEAEEPPCRRPGCG